jgi:hypothetical protein
MERVLFGDNQFFQASVIVDGKHRARTTNEYASSIIDSLDQAIISGIDTLVCTSDDRMAIVCRVIRANPDKYAGFKIYPCLPNAQDHANMITEPIIFDTSIKGVRHFLDRFSHRSNDYLSNLKQLINAEMSIFKHIETPVIFLQHTITDLLMGLGMTSILKGFYDHIRTLYRAEVGFMTMNMPMLLSFLEREGINNPVVCTAINKAGFRMSGGKDLYEETLRTKKFRAIAMEIQGGGALPIIEAVEYVTQLPNIESILFSSNSKENIRQMALTIKHFDTLTEPEKFFRSKIEERRSVK